jgi:head-tail adaptor
MKPAGLMRENTIRVERQVAGADDGFGNTLPATWSIVLTCWAAFRPQFGREQIEAGRAESSMIGTLTLRRSTASLGITAADRVVFTAGPFAGREFQIRSIIPTPDNREIEMTLESGVAT